MQGLHYGKGLIYYRPIFRLTKCLWFYNINRIRNSSMFIPSVQIVWWQGFASIYEVRFFLYNHHLRVVQYSQIDFIGVIVVIRRVSIGSTGRIGTNRKWCHSNGSTGEYGSQNGSFGKYAFHWRDWDQIVLNCIPFAIVLDSCCISIGDLTRDCLVFLKCTQVLDFGCFVLEIWVLRASVFLFETTVCIDDL